MYNVGCAHGEWDSAILFARYKSRLYAIMYIVRARSCSIRQNSSRTPPSIVSTAILSERANLPRVSGSRPCCVDSAIDITNSRGSSYSGKSQFLSSTRKLFVLQPALHLWCRDGVIMSVTKEATEITLIGLMEISDRPFNLFRWRDSGFRSIVVLIKHRRKQLFCSPTSLA